MHTRLERQHTTAGTGRGRGETVKPVFIEDRAASSMDLIAAAHAALPHWARPTHLTSLLGGIF